MNAVTINQEQRLFVFQNSGWVSCLGFDVVFNKLKQIVEYLRLDWEVKEEEVGSMQQYAAYKKAVELFSENPPSDTWFDPGTEEGVKKALEKARKNDTKIRIFLGNPETGRDWVEESDVIGRVGRSTGAFKVPLLISEGEDFGGAILTKNVLRILDVENGKEIYRHPAYKEPELTVQPIDDPDLKKKGYTHEVLHFKTCQARFKHFGAACQYVAFMLGYSFEQP